MPERIQRKRTRGWRMPEGAIYVGRPSRWGNPFRVVREDGVGWSLRGIDEERGEWTGIGRELACAYAKSFYWSWITGERAWPGLPDPPSGSELEKLSGHDLACWCPIPFACHADVLLALTNREVAV